MKDSTLSARVENNVKVEAEDILQNLGIPVSVVINSLYRQIIYHHGIPFSLTIPSEPRTIDVIVGQTKQTFYETFTRTALRERSIPFIIKAPLSDTHANNNSKLEAFARLEASRKAATETIDYDSEREEAMNEKFGSID